MKKKKKLRLPAYILIFLVVLFAFSNINIEQKNERENSNISNIEDNVEVQMKSKTINMTIIGDIMCHNTQYMDAYNSSTDTYDFSYVFENIEEYIQNADIAIGNLETTFAGKKIGYSSYPTFNTPEAMATDLKELGLDVLTTTNNHSLDKGYTRDRKYDYRIR